MPDRLIFFGRNHGFGITLRAFSGLLTAMRGSKHRLVHVVVSDDHHGQPETLEALADAAGLPWSAASGNDVNAPAFVAHLRSLSPTLALTVQFPQLYRPALRAVTPRGCLNVHRGWPLRGGAIDERAIVGGLETYWVVLHHVIDRIDAGPIIARRAVAISNEETGHSLAAKADAAGEALVAKDFVRLLGAPIPAGNLQELSHTQYANKGTVAPICDLRQPAAYLERLARAFHHPRKNGLQLTVGRRQVRVDRIMCGEATGTPGTVLASGADGVTIAAGAGSLIIRNVRVESGVAPLAQVLKEQGLMVGECLLDVSAAEVTR